MRIARKWMQSTNLNVESKGSDTMALADIFTRTEGSAPNRPAATPTYGEARHTPA